MKRDNAILIFEAPWQLNEHDQNTVSVLPFFEGLQRLSGNFDLYHSHFYESTSFEMALENLTRVKYDKTYIYIASHGRGKRLHNMNLKNALEKINAKAQSHNIVGVLVGSCLVGNNTDLFGTFMMGSSITWKFGYKCIVDWFDGTMLDLAIFRQVLELEHDDLKSSETILGCFKNATSNYRPEGSIGWKKLKDGEGYTDANREQIAKSLTLIIQSKGKGKVPYDYSASLFDTPEVD